MTAPCPEWIATASLASSRSARPHASQDDLGLLAAAQGEGGALDDVVRVGKAAPLSRTAASAAALLRRGARHARAGALPLAEAAVGAPHDSGAPWPGKLERRALRARALREGVRGRFQFGA